MKSACIRRLFGAVKDVKKKLDELRVLLASALMGMVHWTYEHSPIPQRAIERWLALTTPFAFILISLVILYKLSSQVPNGDGLVVVADFLLLINLLLALGLLVSLLMLSYIILLNEGKDSLKIIWEEYTGPLESGNAGGCATEPPAGSLRSLWNRFLIQFAVAYTVSFLSAISGAFITAAGFSPPTGAVEPLIQVFIFLRNLPPFFQIHRAYKNVVGAFFSFPPDTIFLLFVLIIPILLFTFPVRNLIRVFRNFYHILFVSVRENDSLYGYVLLGLIFLIMGIIWPIYALISMIG